MPGKNVRGAFNAAFVPLFAKRLEADGEKEACAFAGEALSGLTFILVPLDTPGITVRPIEKLNNKKAFAEVFFDNARVPIENQLGEEGKGFYHVLEFFDEKRSSFDR